MKEYQRSTEGFAKEMQRRCEEGVPKEILKNYQKALIKTK
jgi:hypothetical protein